MKRMKTETETYLERWENYCRDLLLGRRRATENEKRMAAFCLALAYSPVEVREIIPARKGKRK